jgi:hypothetical protein
MMMISMMIDKKKTMTRGRGERFVWEYRGRERERESVESIDSSLSKDIRRTCGEDAVSVHAVGDVWLALILSMTPSLPPPIPISLSYVSHSIQEERNLSTNAPPRKVRYRSQISFSSSNVLEARISSSKITSEVVSKTTEAEQRDTQREREEEEEIRSWWR